MKKKNPLRTEAAIERARKYLLRRATDGVFYWRKNGADLVIDIVNLDDTTIAELSVNDYLKKAPYKRGIKKAMKVLTKRK